VYRTLERIAVWSAERRDLLRVLVALAVVAVAVVLLTPDAIDRVIGTSFTASGLGLLAFFGIVGIGGLAAQVLHVEHWFGTKQSGATPPLIYGVHPQVRPAIVLMIILGLALPIGCLSLLVHFVSVMFG
jgi:hypothetical protein